MVLKINREPNPEHLRKYRGLLNSVGISELHPKWKERITDFLEWLIRERTLATTYGYGVRVFEIAKYTGGDFLSPTDEELKSYIGSKKAKGVSATNINITVTALTKFYTWLLGKNPKCLGNIKDEYIKGTGSKREEIITEEELDKLIQASDYPRDKALWSLLYDSGCRIGELQTLRVKDIEMNDYGLTMKVNGKTGQRWVVVVGNSIVYLQEWLKVHPANKDRDAYVFCEIRGKSRGKFLERQRIANNLNNATERAGIALKNLTLLQKAEFQQQNNKIGKSFIQAQQNGNSTPNYTFNTMTAKNGAEITVASQGHNPGTDFVRVSNLPSGVGSDGQWTMVSVNYFVYHAPWWLGGWSVTYGEQDTINSLYAGNDAQHFVNSATNGANDQAILDGIALGAIGTGLAFAAPTLGISALAGGIIAGILAATGAAVAYLTSQWTGKLNSLYQSTYANEPAGKKYVWMYDVIDYYYPSVTVVGVLASSIGQYGYLSNGNVVTFSGNVPFISYGGFTGLDYVVALSGYTQAIGNNFGWNTWLYGGDPN